MHKMYEIKYMCKTTGGSIGCQSAKPFNHRRQYTDDYSDQESELSNGRRHKLS